MAWVKADTGRALWKARVQATPERPFLLDGDRAWTFGETDERVRRLAGGLLATGVASGTRVLVALGNTAEAFLVHAALRELNAVIVPLVPGLPFNALAFQADHSRAPILIAGGASAEVLVPRRRELAHVRTVIRQDEITTLARHGAPPADHQLPPVRAQDPSAIFYTSGSTGRPKGVVLPAGAFVSAGHGYSHRFEVTDDDTYLVATPMAHAVGGLTAPSMMIGQGGRLAIVDRFSPTRFWTDVAITRASTSILFPAQLNLLLQVATPAAPRRSTFRLAITHAPNDAFRARFGAAVELCWGMTETGAGGSTGSIPGDPCADEREPGYVGHPMAGCEVRIVDDLGTPQPPGVDGEICLRHPTCMLGYLDDRSATDATLRDGWIHSGDVGHLQPDGGLVYRGRIKNMIKRAGENVSAEEVEVALDRHPAVAESLVLGVPDPLRTEELAAIVVTQEGAGELDPSELTAFVAEELGRWKAPRYLALRADPLPRLGNGKIDRTALVAALDLDACWDRERAPATNRR